MAPEILLTKPYNSLVDVWSIGIIMLELAEGNNPYRGMTLSRIMYAMKNEKAPRLRNKEGRWSNEFIDFVNNRCLIKNPVERADTYELLMHPFMKDADDEDHKDAYLYFITDYFNCSKIQIKANKFDMTN
jgi:serine/threonine protein kinase